MPRRLSPFQFSRSAGWTVLLTAALTLALPSAGMNVAFAANVDPRDFGFDIPPGPISLGTNEQVTTRDAEGNPVVGRIYVKVGDARIVLLPDGQLVSRTEAESPRTDRPFVPLSTEDLQKKLGDGPLRGFQTKKTKHYVFFYNTSENFAVGTSRILESMIPGMMTHAKQQRVDVHEPEVPLVAIMFRTEAEFQNFRRMQPGVVAYYHIASNHVVMYEESDLYRIKPELGIQESISTIAHEGAHQILHNIGVQQRLSRWPMWLSEGIAEYYAPTSFGRNLRWKGAGQVNDLRMFNLELFLKGRDADTPSGQMVEHTVAAARLTSTGYASAWSLTHFLAKTQKEKFHSYVRDNSRLGPFEGPNDIVPPGIIPQNVELFKKHFGDDFGKLEAGLVKHLKALPYSDPFGEWPHFVAAVEVAGGRKPRREANLFHSQEMARKWILETVENLPEEQRQSVQHDIRSFPNRLVAEQFARRFLGAGR